MIEQAWEQARDKKVLFVGENIEDEYVYVEPLYKPSKETILAVHEVSRERFSGGVLAAAYHIRKWVDVRAVANKDPVVKTRYVQNGFNRKLFELYDSYRVESLWDVNEVEQEVGQADVVIVLDFGHGFITDRLRDLLFAAKFLAVNAQSNAGNWGFNPVTKYRRADYVCVDYQEARLAVGMQWEPLAMVIERLCERMQTDKIIVTEGSRGASWKGGHIAALETHPVDTMGAGDCFMAYTAPLIACGLSLADAALVGCVAASMKTEIVGHRASVKPDAVLQRVRNELSARDRRATA